MKKTYDSFTRKSATSSLTQKPQKPQAFPSTLTKKLSLALDEKLNVDNKKNSDEELYENFEQNEFSNTFDKEKKQASVIEKAKALIEKSKSMNPGQRYKTFIPNKDDAFLTSIHVLAENIPRKTREEPAEPIENIDENDMMKNLWLDNYKETDDLAELRKMINRTKKNISDYASELYTLKNNVNDVKLVYDDLGYKVKNNDLMYEMDKVFNELMPSGDKNSMFTYEFYDDPSRNKPKKTIINQKKQEGKKKNGRKSSLIK